MMHWNLANLQEAGGAKHVFLAFLDTRPRWNLDSKIWWMIVPLHLEKVCQLMYGFLATTTAKLSCQLQFTQASLPN